MLYISLRDFWEPGFPDLQFPNLQEKAEKERLNGLDIAVAP